MDKLLLRLEPELPSFEKRYRQLRLKLIKFFTWRRCQDADNLADETISRVVKNILAGEVVRADNPYSYVYGIAKYVFMEYLRDKKKRQEIVDNFPDARPPVEEDVRDCRLQCLQKLPLDKRQLLEEYYSNESSREELADMHHITLNALRLQIHRIKNDLKICYRDCIKRL
ncbi:MAG: hypothetical protein L0229_00120 [Blastocatellia bacterium]|nr:hypothetical protein [Blastocatellia bacterium]